MLHAELLDVCRDVNKVDNLLLQNVMQENNHKSDHSVLVDFVLVIREATLMHAILYEKLDKLFWELNVVAKAIENLKQVC